MGTDTFCLLGHYFKRDSKGVYTHPIPYPWSPTNVYWRVATMYWGIATKSLSRDLCDEKARRYASWQWPGCSAIMMADIICIQSLKSLCPNFVATLSSTSWPTTSQRWSWISQQWKTCSMIGLRLTLTMWLTSPIGYASVTQSKSSIFVSLDVWRYHSSSRLIPRL